MTTNVLPQVTATHIGRPAIVRTPHAQPDLIHIRIEHSVDGGDWNYLFDGYSAGTDKARADAGRMLADRRHGSNSRSEYRAFVAHEPFEISA